MEYNKVIYRTFSFSVRHMLNNNSSGLIHGDLRTIEKAARGYLTAASEATSGPRDCRRRGE